MTRGVTLDTGALIALDRGNSRLVALLDEVALRGLSLAVPAGVVAQAWRDGSRQARLAKLLRARESEVVALDESTARAIGVLLGETGISDVIDASVVMCAVERGHAVVTSDPDDLRRLDARLSLHQV